MLSASATTSQVSGTGTSVNLNTGTTQPGRVLVVGLIMADYDLTSPALSSIDCNGQALVLWSSYDVGNDMHRVYYLNPPTSTGIQPVNVTFSALASFALLAMQFVGCDPANPLVAAVKANATDANPTDSVNLPRQSALFSLLRVNYTAARPTVTANSGQVKLTEQNVAFDGTHNFLGIGARIAGLGVGGVPLADDWTLTASLTWRLQSVVVNEKQYGSTIGGYR